MQQKRSFLYRPSRDCKHGAPTHDVTNEARLMTVELTTNSNALMETLRLPEALRPFADSCVMMVARFLFLGLIQTTKDGPPIELPTPLYATLMSLPVLPDVLCVVYDSRSDSTDHLTHSIEAYRTFFASEEGVDEYFDEKGIVVLSLLFRMSENKIPQPLCTKEVACPIEIEGEKLRIYVLLNTRVRQVCEYIDVLLLKKYRASTRKVELSYMELNSDVAPPSCMRGRPSIGSYLERDRTLFSYGLGLPRVYFRAEVFPSFYFE
jgi:hypothetical protein